MCKGKYIKKCISNEWVSFFIYDIFTLNLKVEFTGIGDFNKF